MTNNIKSLYVLHTRDLSMNGKIVNYHPIGNKQSSLRKLVAVYK